MCFNAKGNKFGRHIEGSGFGGTMGGIIGNLIGNAITGTFMANSILSDGVDPCE